jgi:hypothetical protein
MESPLLSEYIDACRVNFSGRWAPLFVSEGYAVSIFKTEVITLNCICFVIHTLFSDAIGSSGYMHVENFDDSNELEKL